MAVFRCGGWGRVGWATPASSPCPGVEKGKTTKAKGSGAVGNLNRWGSGALSGSCQMGMQDKTRQDKTSQNAGWGGVGLGSEFMTVLSWHAQGNTWGID